MNFKHLITPARLSLFVVVLAIALMLSLRPHQGTFEAMAAEAPTPLLTGLLKPSPSSSPTQQEPNEPDQDGSKDEEPEKRRGQKRSDRTDEQRGQTDDAPEVSHGQDGARHSTRRATRRKRKDRQRSQIVDWVPRSDGSFHTQRLVDLSAKLVALGYRKEDVFKRVYAPFIVGGRASWTDTWAAPRRGPGRLLRRHQGQDVFCDPGAALLAAEPGRVEFGEDELGGRIARLHRKEGGYWYYAHLRDWNLEEFPSGGTVARGDVIGYCGNTGNARWTPSHVHFGLYTSEGAALDPFDSLVSWLREAESRLDRIESEAIARQSRLHATGLLSLRRHFGDRMTPYIPLPSGCQVPSLGESALDTLSFLL